MSPEVLSLLGDQQQFIKNNFDPETFHEEPILKAWHEAYRSFGAKKYRCSVHNLYRMILNGKALGHINTLVDIYNIVSLKYLLPVRW